MPGLEPAPPDSRSGVLPTTPLGQGGRYGSVGGHWNRLWDWYDPFVPYKTRKNAFDPPYAAIFLQTILLYRVKKGHRFRGHNLGPRKQ